MTKEEAIEEINKAFEPAFANYIITALTEGATVSDKVLEQEPILDKIRAEIEQEYNKYRNMSEKWNERACGVGITLEIIDKCRKEVNNDGLEHSI